jgi:hypothetical protein
MATPDTVLSFGPPPAFGGGFGYNAAAVSGEELRFASEPKKKGERKCQAIDFS